MTATATCPFWCTYGHGGLADDPDVHTAVLAEDSGHEVEIQVVAPGQPPELAVTLASEETAVLPIGDDGPGGLRAVAAMLCRAADALEALDLSGERLGLGS
jgi:hypothetical protein